jgi:hypothetical protein
VVFDLDFQGAENLGVISFHWPTSHPQHLCWGFCQFPKCYGCRLYWKTLCGGEGQDLWNSTAMSLNHLPAVKTEHFSWPLWTLGVLFCLEFVQCII